jgi:HlyD family secretion protein
LAAVVVVVLLVVLRVRWFAPVPTRAQRVDRGPVVAAVFGRGTIESDSEVQLGFELVGRLASVLVDEGDHVVLGQELAHLQPDQLRAELQTAASSVDAARSSLLRLAADERRAREALELAENEERRTRALAASGAGSARDLDVALSQTRLLRAELDRVLASRTEASRSIDVASGGVAQRQAVVRRATLLAPFDGLIVRRLLDAGDTVTVGSTVFRLVAPDDLVVRAWIDETALGRLSEGQEVDVRFPSEPDRALRGSLRRIGREVDRQTHELLVDIAVQRMPERVALGQRADVWIEVARRDGVVRLPLDFLRREGRGTFCFVNRAGRIARGDVSVGLVGRQHLEVTVGLSEGDVVLDALEPGGILPSGRRWEAR